METLIVMVLAIASCLAAFFLCIQKGEIAEGYVKLLFISLVTIVVLSALLASGTITTDSLMSIFDMYKEAAQ